MAPTPANQLSIDQALKDGWAAFRRSPWAFVGFALLSGFLWFLAALIPIPIVDNIVTTLVVLWATVGGVRGAWIALEGGRPRFDDFTRLEWGSLWRLFSRQFVLGLLLMLISGATVALAVKAAEATPLAMDLLNRTMAMDSSDPNQMSALLPDAQNLALQLLGSPIALLLLLLGVALNLYLQVNQAFLGYLAVLQGLGPIQALQVGFTTVQRLWWSVLGLLALQVGVVLLGVLACGFGVLAAIPVVTAMSASAYRQLFGDDDAAGFLSGR